MTKRLTIAAALGATLLAGTALAQADMTQRGGRGMGAGALMQADANRDGVVTRAEAGAAADRQFAAMDTDRDGKVTGDERRAAMAARRGMRQDANKDGAVTRAEAVARAAQRFDRVDANRDGTLSADERQAAKADRPERRRMDWRGQRGGAREVSAADHRERALRMFDRVDTNKNGQVDRTEIEAARLLARARMADTTE